MPAGSDEGPGDAGLREGPPAADTYRVTLVDAGPTPPSPPESDPPPPRPGPGPGARLWAAPFWAHVAALSLVLVALLPFIGTAASFSADEGAAIIQARSLSRGDGWIVEHPLPEIDPTGDSYPIELSSRGPNGVGTFAKHPVYAFVMAAADRLGGVTAMILLSLLGTVVAACVAAALAARIDTGLARSAFWLVGLGSPLLFDGYLVIAHTLGAALAGAAVLVAVVAIERRRPLVALAVAPIVAAAVLLRTEAVLFAVALAVVTAIVAIRPVHLGRRAALAAAVAAGSGGVGAMVVERWWVQSILGGTPVSTGGGPGAGDGYLSDKVHAFVLTWLRPTYDAMGPGELALVVMAVCIAAVAYVVHRHPGDRRPIALFSSVAAVSAVFALAASPRNLVPGLLIACPAALAGFLALRRRTFASPTSAIATGTFVLFAVAVAATQYATGGSGEWGGRYFALGLPVIAPVIVLALRDQGRRLTHAPTRRWVAGSLAVCTVAVTAMGIQSIRSTRQFTDELMTSIDRAGRQVTAGGDRPVLVTTHGAVPRLAWATFDDQRWLLDARPRLAETVGRLRSAGVSEFVLVTTDRKAEVPLLGPGVTVEETDDDLARRGWSILRVSVGG